MPVSPAYSATAENGYLAQKSRNICDKCCVVAAVAIKIMSKRKLTSLSS
jgi:hypothetical protein